MGGNISLMVENENPTLTPPPAEAPSRDDLRLASNSALTEDLALGLLGRAELAASVFEQLAKNANVLKLRKVKLALAGHPHAPRHISVPLVRQFYTFDLMQVALSPTVPTDVKVIAEDVLISRLRTVTLGERLSLARRASGRVAAALLVDSDPRVMDVALENGRLTEAMVIQAVLRPDARAPFVQAVSHHSQWSFRRQVRLALLRTEFLPLARALEFTRGLPLALLREVLASSQLSTTVKTQLLREAETEFLTTESRRHREKQGRGQQAN
jgi:hypothetical protein